MARREWRHISPEEATADTAAWQIVHQGKQAVFAFEGKERLVHFGAPELFHSFEEFRAFAQFVDAHPDFVLFSGNEQDPINPASITLDGSYVTYTTVGLGMPEPQTLSVPVAQLHRKTWVSQKPWEPIPREHRFWLPALATADGPNYWRIGTTEGAAEDCWSQMKEGNYISIGWKYLGDLRMLLGGLSESAARAKLRRSVSASNEGVVTKYVNQIYDFYASMRPGDLVVAMNGRRLRDVGEVTGDYEWVDDDSPQASRRRVRWLGVPEQAWENSPGFRTTLYRFSDRVADVNFLRRAAGLEATRYWAIQANPDIYDIERALRETNEDTWFIDNGNVQVGDRLLIWKSKGSDDWSGIVGLAEVAEAAKPREPVHLEYFRKLLSEEGLRRERFLLRFVRSNKLPIHKEDLKGSLRELTVARGLQGNVFKVTPEQWNALMEAINGWPSIIEAPPEAPMPMHNIPPLNQILYGPPGTGKTFATIRRAVEIADPEFTGAIHTNYKDRYDELRGEGRIEFVTFHQSYGYEDFVEGIRPVMDDESPLAHFRVDAGVLKRVALRAMENALEPASPVAPFHGGGWDATSTSLPSFSQAWHALLAEVEANPGKIFPGKKAKYRFEVTEHDGLLMQNDDNLNTRPQTLGFNLANDWFDAFKRGDTQSAKRIAGSGHYPARALVFKELERIAQTWTDKRTGATQEMGDADGIEEIDDVSVRDFLWNGSRSGFRLKRNAPRYVLIIDEINRGNVSKVLGELITLLEDDKRIGAENALTVTLPYSRELFGLPTNLHVLGTMNTADKSIALVDVALRRRFEFEELPPRFDVCPDLTSGMRTVLECLNRRIALRLDRDHRIGHAFFMRVSDKSSFDAVFRRKIVPLLQEYFFNDWEGLRYVLGETGEDGEFIRRPDEHQAREARTKWQWKTDVGQDLTPFASLRANYKVTEE